MRGAAARSGPRPPELWTASRGWEGLGRLQPLLGPDRTVEERGAGRGREVQVKRGGSRQAVISGTVQRALTWFFSELEKACMARAW